MKQTESRENLVASKNSLDVENTEDPLNEFDNVTETVLTQTEKRFLLTAERGDCATVRQLIAEFKDQPEELDINCRDPLERSALIAALENENIELINLLLEAGIQVKDALLHAIKEEYVEGVETLLLWEEQHHVPGTNYVSFNGLVSSSL